MTPTHAVCIVVITRKEQTERTGDMNTTTTRNGWHRTTVTTTDRTTSTERTWDVTWRTQRPQCAGHYGYYRADWDTVAVWDAGHRPFAGADQYGELQPAPAQCGNCGQMFFGEFTAREV